MSVDPRLPVLACRNGFVDIGSFHDPLVILPNAGTPIQVAGNLLGLDAYTGWRVDPSFALEM
jgi:hypothetical protein